MNTTSNLRVNEQLVKKNTSISIKNSDGTLGTASVKNGRTMFELMNLN